ncbi:hypothetical protein E9993_11785 [Labilibacter sediminis]|nr:hypothetical protein E9993_11785 [Labilibacter sediminis]
MEKYVFYALGEEKPEPIKIDLNSFDITHYEEMVIEADRKIHEANPDFTGQVTIFGFGDA